MGCKRFFLKERKNDFFSNKINLPYCFVVFFVGDHFGVDVREMGTGIISGSIRASFQGWGSSFAVGIILGAVQVISTVRPKQNRIDIFEWQFLVSLV